SGKVHRTELSAKARETEPSKPVLAQFALRVLDAFGPEWLDRHDVYPRVAGFIEYLEREYTGPNGLQLTHSALQSGFDSDLLTAALPDKSVEGPDTSALMVLEYRALAAVAARLGRDSDAARWAEKALSLRDRIEALLWNDDGFYVGLQNSQPVSGRV